MWYKSTALAALVGAIAVADGQQVKEPPLAARRVRLQLTPFAGIYVPHGDHRRDFQAAATNGLQAGYGLGAFTHLVASVSLTDGKSRLPALRRFPTTRLWQYDVGIEFNTAVALGNRLRLLPSFGFGGGARNYHYPSKGIANLGYPAGYYAVGTELRRGAMGLRVESRSYLSLFRAPLDPPLHVRDDGFVTMGIVYHQ